MALFILRSCLKNYCACHFNLAGYLLVAVLHVLSPRCALDVASLVVLAAFLKTASKDEDQEPVR